MKPAWCTGAQLLAHLDVGGSTDLEHGSTPAAGISFLDGQLYVVICFA